MLLLIFFRHLSTKSNLLWEYNTKYEGYEFNWKLSIYTEYEGKKEVNNLLSKTLMILKGLDSSSIDNFYIDSVWLDNANIFRNFMLISAT